MGRCTLTPRTCSLATRVAQMHTVVLCEVPPVARWSRIGRRLKWEKGSIKMQETTEVNASKHILLHMFGFILCKEIARIRI